MAKKRKGRRKAPKKKRAKLSVTFKCPMCYSVDAVDVVLNFKDKVGKLRCRRCSDGYSCVINDLSAPVDVYCTWIDALEEANRKGGAVGQEETLSSLATAAPVGTLIPSLDIVDDAKADGAE